jgi:hypothetical protein
MSLVRVGAARVVVWRRRISTSGTSARTTSGGREEARTAQPRPARPSPAPARPSPGTCVQRASVGLDDLEELARLGRSGQLHFGSLEDRSERLHPVIHVVLGIPNVNDVESVTNQPCSVGLSALRVAQTLLVDLPPGRFVCRTSVGLRRVDDVNDDCHCGFSLDGWVRAQGPRRRVLDPGLGGSAGQCPECVSFQSPL